MLDKIVYIMIDLMEINILLEMIKLLDAFI